MQDTPGTVRIGGSSPECLLGVPAVWKKWTNTVRSRYSVQSIIEHGDPLADAYMQPLAASYAYFYAIQTASSFPSDALL